MRYWRNNGGSLDATRRYLSVAYVVSTRWRDNYGEVTAVFFDTAGKVKAFGKQFVAHAGGGCRLGCLPVGVVAVEDCVEHGFTQHEQWAGESFFAFQAELVNGLAHVQFVASSMGEIIYLS